MYIFLLTWTLGRETEWRGFDFLNDKVLMRDRSIESWIFLGDLLSKGVRLAGMDLTEINPRKAGGHLPTGEDQTYRIAANIIKKLLWENG